MLSPLSPAFFESLPKKLAAPRTIVPTIAITIRFAINTTALPVWNDAKMPSIVNPPKSSSNPDRKASNAPKTTMISNPRIRTDTIFIFVGRCVGFSFKPNTPPTLELKANTMRATIPIANSVNTANNITAISPCAMAEPMSDRFATPCIPIAPAIAKIIERNIKKTTPSPKFLPNFRSAIGIAI